MKLAMVALAAATLVAPVVTASPAYAAADSQFVGGCGLDAYNFPTDPPDPTYYTGAVYAATVVFAAGAAADNPVDATVTCTVRLNGSPVVTRSFHGAVTVVGEWAIGFHALDEEILDICTTVDFTSNDTPTRTRCGDVITDTVDQSKYAANVYIGNALCDLLKTYRRFFVGSPIFVATDGSLWVLDQEVVDCTATGFYSPMFTANAGEEKVKHKHKQPADTTAPATPYHPKGTVEVSKSLTGPVTFAFTGFVPPVDEWDCETTTSYASCMPPTAPAGSENVCGTLTVTASSTTTGSVNGTSACASGPFASASSNGPSTVPSSTAAKPDTTFAWTCASTANGSLAWSVRCTVG